MGAAIPKRLRQLAGFILKFALAGGIIAYMLRDPHEIVDGFRTFDLRWLLPAMVAYGAHMVVCAWRWRRLALMLGVRLGAMEALSLTMQGYFFSLVIPGGAIGGDVVKMGVVSKRAPSGGKMEGAFTVLMDRIVGMIALFALELAILLPAVPILLQVSIPNFPLDERTRRLGILLLALLGITGIAASCVIFFHRVLEKLPGVGATMRWGDRITRGMVSRLTAATDVYLRNWRELLGLIAASIPFVHLMTVLPFGFLLAGLGIPFRCFDIVVAVTIGNIIGLIPLFPAGVGGRDVAVITLLAAAGIAPAEAKTAQLLYTAILLFFNLAGGIFFVFDRGETRSALAAATAAEEERE